VGSSSIKVHFGEAAETKSPRRLLPEPGLTLPRRRQPISENPPRPVNSGVSRGFAARRSSACFRNRRTGRPFKWHRTRRYILLYQVPNHYRKQEGNQLGAPVFQGQPREQEGDQLRAPLFRHRSFHNLRCKKICAICWRNLPKQILNQLQSQIQYMRCSMANSILTRTRRRVSGNADPYVAVQTLGLAGATQK
jgi:hypothetical protein